MNIVKKIKNKTNIILRRTFAGYVRKHYLTNFPDLISFQTNSYCNSQCVGCPHPIVKNKVPQGKMQDDLFRKIIDECSNYPVKVILPFFMNEPFIDKNIIEKVNYIKEKIPHASVKLNSNGALLSREVAQKLVASKVDQLTLGIQGIDKEDFDRFMVGLDYEQTMENVKYLSTLKRNCIIDVNILPFNSIKHKIDRTVQFWSDLGFIPWLTEPWDSAGIMGTSEINAIPTRKAVKGCYNIDSPFFSQQPLHIINILFNGDVIGCCMDWEQKNIMGNISNKSIQEVWFSREFNAFRDKVYGVEKSSANFICKKCNLSI